MANIYINDPEKNEYLVDRIREVIRDSVEMRFLVGYFYFSGIQELMESLRAKAGAGEPIDLRILVGMDTEEQIREQSRRVVEAEPDGKVSKADNIENYISSLHSFLRSDENDSREFGEDLRFYLGLLADGRIKIRKTREPNHGKLYLFKLNNSAHSFIITGSSNLTMSGLKGNQEFNVGINDDQGYSLSKEYFDRLWDRSIPITEDEGVRERVIKVLETNSPAVSQDPFTALTAVLRAYVEANTYDGNEDRTDLLPEGYTDYAYQRDAVNQAISIIKERGGVILADVVGLGKTVIASRIINALGAKNKTVIICPPGLRGDSTSGGWETYMAEFRTGAHVFSRGKLDAALEHCNTYDPELIIIDEAHSFRNMKTGTYDMIKQICAERKVILLTATPLNNSPLDLLALLGLFMNTKDPQVNLKGLDSALTEAARLQKYAGFIKSQLRSSDAAVRRQGRAAFRAWAEKLFIPVTPDVSDDDMVKHLTRVVNAMFKRVRGLIAPVVIRRNRKDLDLDNEYKKDLPPMPKVVPPIEKAYGLTPEQNAFYDKVLKFFDNEGDNDANGNSDDVFSGAIYMPFRFGSVKGERSDEDAQFESVYQTQLRNHMKRLVVKRLESSFGAFVQTLENFVEYYRLARDFVEATGTFVMGKELVRALDGMDPESDEFSSTLTEYWNTGRGRGKDQDSNTYEFSESCKEEFLNAIKGDIRCFTEFIGRAKELRLEEDDPKFDTVCREMAKILKIRKHGEPVRKIILFTEYMDTVKHLKKRFDSEDLALLGVDPKRILCIDGDITDSLRATIRANFENLKESERKNDYDVIIATDRLSEGFNLPMAGAVINYDIPWNPVRVIQRVGRINRIGSKIFDELYIYNFFPGPKAEEAGLDIESIAKGKLAMIHGILGEDAQILSEEEEPTASNLFKKVNSLPEEEESFITKVRNRLDDIRTERPEVYEAAGLLSNNIKTSKKAKETENIFFARRGRNIYVVENQPGTNKLNETSLEDAYDRIACDYGEPRLDLPWDFWDNYKDLKQQIVNGKLKGSEGGLQGNENKARNILKTIQSDPAFESEKDLIDAMINDLQNYGTNLTASFCKDIAARENKPQELLQLIRDRFPNEAQKRRYIANTRRQRRTGGIELMITFANRKVE
ncbi:MAG: NgoFVII family restriction endonuclease [Abditibacteriota bacterium]|nr:NgoFVII family restriction endonuclease [Abditibacteriota bacterium]